MEFQIILFRILHRLPAGKLEQLSVYGNDYDTPDGTGVRDYIHVEDLASGHVCAIDYAMKNKGFEAVNLGTGKGSSVLKLLRLTKRPAESL